MLEAKPLRQFGSKMSDVSVLPGDRKELRLHADRQSDRRKLQYRAMERLHHRLRGTLTKDTEKLQTKLCRLVGQAIADYRMIEEDDRVMVCISGGKDSYGLLDILLVLRDRAPINFDLIAVNLDQKQPGFPAEVLPTYLTKLGIPFHVEQRDTYSVVKRLIPEGQTTCSLCSRLRRGHLYRLADELGATKVALGHHRDDMIETLFLNLFFAGKIKGMPPKLRSKDGRHIIIRPLAYVKETDLARYAVQRSFPIIPCDLCGSQRDLKRQQVKRFLREWESRSPGCRDSIFAALSNIAPSLLMDRRLFDFEAFQPISRPPYEAIDDSLSEDDASPLMHPGSLP